MLASLRAGGAAGVYVKVRCVARVWCVCVSECGVEGSHSSDPAIRFDLFPAVFAYHKRFDEVFAYHFSMHCDNRQLCFDYSRWVVGGCLRLSYGYLRSEEFQAALLYPWEYWYLWSTAGAFDLPGLCGLAEPE